MLRTVVTGVVLTTAILAASLRAQRSDARRIGPEDGLLAVVVEGKHGFIDVRGRMAIPPTFDMAWGFSEGRASAWLNGRAGFIDRSGTFVIPPRYEYAKAFHEGLAEVQLGGLWGFLTTDGAFAIQPQFEETRQFSDGRAAVRLDERWGFIDRAGTLVIAAQYRSPSLFENARALVQVDQQWLAIDRNGEPTSRDGDDLIPEQRGGKWGRLAQPAQTGQPAPSRVAPVCRSARKVKGGPPGWAATWGQGPRDAG